MKNAKQLREERDAKLTAARALTDAAKAGGRQMTPEEATQFDGLMDEADALNPEITRALRAEAAAAEQAGRSAPLNTHSTTEKRDLASYSVLKAVRAAMPEGHGRQALAGIELEMHQQAVSEARDAGRHIEGVGIPQMLISKRDNSITMPTQSEDGSAVMYQDTIRPIIDLARPRTVLRELGATFLTGLTGNIGVPSLASGAVSTWKAEVAELDKSDQKFADAEMTPHRLGTYAKRSKQFLIQTSPQVEALLRSDLEISIAQALEIAAINGSGANNQPTGILNTSGVLSMAMGTNGAAPTRDMLVMLEALVEGSNINTNTLGYLLNVATKAKLKMTKVDAGSGLFLLDSNSELNGYPYKVTTNVPKTLTKGTSTAVASAAIFGDWSKLFVGQWGGLDLTVDPYTLATNGQVRIIIQSFYDVLVAQPAAFAIVKDILTA